MMLSPLARPRICWTLAFAIAAVPACASAPPTKTSPAPARDDEVHTDFAPTPFTIDELRAGCPLGRVIEYHVELPGRPTVRTRMTFTRVDPQSAEIEDLSTSIDGTPLGPPKRKSAPWEELQKHGRFPRAQTTIDRDTITVTAGTFDCVRYVVTGDEGSVKTLWFAKTLPGPPVKMVVRNGADVLMTMTMVSSR